MVSEPPNPYLSGVANLFTRDFWQMGRTRLAPGGIWSQWVQLYGMGEGEVRSLLRTFTQTYPHVALYAGLERSDDPQVDLVLVGSDRPIEPTFERARALLAHPPAAAALERVGITGPADLVAMHTFDREGLLAFVGEGPQVTDDNMRVEYAAPLYLHRDTQVDNWRAISAAAQIPWRSLPDDPAELAALAEAYAARGDPARASAVRARIADPRGAAPTPGAP